MSNPAGSSTMAFSARKRTRLADAEAAGERSKSKRLAPSDRSAATMTTKSTTPLSAGSALVASSPLAPTPGGVIGGVGSVGSVGKRVPSHSPFLCSSSSSPSPLPSSAAAMMSSSCAICPVMRSELESLRAELDHATSLRLLDRRRHDQAESRLRRQIQFLTEESEEYRRLSDEARDRSEQDLGRMAAARREALDRLRDAERRMVVLVAMGRAKGKRYKGDHDHDHDHDHDDRVGHVGGGDIDVDVDAQAELSRERRKRRSLEERMEAANAEVAGLKGALEDAERRAILAEARLASAVGGGEVLNNDDDDDDEYDDDRDAHATNKGNKDASRDGTPTRPRTDGRSLSNQTSTSSSSSSSSPVSPAPPAVMSELNRVRIRLAEAERKERQLERKLESAQRAAEEAAKNREAARSAESKMRRLRDEVASLTREVEAVRAGKERWDEWAKEIWRRVRDDGATEEQEEEKEKDENDNGGSPPPEIGAVLRRFRSLEEKAKLLADEASAARAQLEASRRRVASLDQQLKSSESSLERSLAEKKDMMDKYRAVDAEISKIRAQEKIWRRENDSLRSLLETYEQTLEERWKRSLNASPGGAGFGTGASLSASDPQKHDEGGVGGNPTVQGLQIGLSSARDQIRILQEEIEEMRRQAEGMQKERTEKQEEHERVLEKFGKLRDALYKEKEKAEQAEDRANRAEMLVGKGHFNDETTRALHLKENPLSVAIREKYQLEIDSLRRALEEKESEVAAVVAASSSSAAGGKTSGDAKQIQSTSSRGGKDAISGLDAQKLHQRLKESFKEQIGLFREGVYLLTGYKIDMVADSDRPKFTVRSMYSDREEDHLLFISPKTKKGEGKMSVSFLDLFSTEMAQILAQSPSFQYMTKFNSIPAFMASVQLSLFEKTTFAG